jgi:hypothetical protein
MPPRAAPRRMKIFPLNNGGGAKRQRGFVRSVFPSRSRQPPEGFAFFPPFLRGIFKGVFMPRCGATFDERQRPPLDKGGLQGGFGVVNTVSSDSHLVQGEDHTIFRGATGLEARRIPSKT